MNDKVLAGQILSLVDLTSLNSDDSEETIIRLCEKAAQYEEKVAAVCVYSKFVALAKQRLQLLQADDVKIATVTNFPGGEQPLAEVLAETRSAIADGADEIDLGMPYRALMKDDIERAAEYVRQSKALCEGDVHLKVIIESGELQTPELIRLASEVAIKAGADFIKTSTGKVPVNATLSAAEVMLHSIKMLNPKVGFKAAGGIRSFDEARAYLALAAEIMGPDWVGPSHFRFGASALLDDLKHHLR